MLERIDTSCSLAFIGSKQQRKVTRVIEILQTFTSTKDFIEDHGFRKLTWRCQSEKTNAKNFPCSLFPRLKLLFNKECKKLGPCWLISSRTRWTIILTCSKIISSWVAWFSLMKTVFIHKKCSLNQSFPQAFETNQSPAAPRKTTSRLRSKLKSFVSKS